MIMKHPTYCRNSGVCFTLLVLAVGCIHSLSIAGNLEDASEAAFKAIELSRFSNAGSAWKIEDDRLVGTSKGQETRCILDTPLQDFEIRLQFRLIQGQATIQYRTNQKNSAGYQFHITNSKDCGLLNSVKPNMINCPTGKRIKYDSSGNSSELGTVSRADLSESAASQWHEIVIIAQHERLIHKVDGAFVADVTDNRTTRPDEPGHFSIQLSAGSPSKIEIRKVRTRPLPRQTPNKPSGPRIAAVVSEYRHNSHADVVVSRLIETDMLNNHGQFPNLQLVSMFTDQVPAIDTSRKLAKQANIPICESIEEALTLGTGKLVVDGVLLVAEHGDYPLSDTGNRQYPKRRLFTEVVRVFEKTGTVVPVFIDKHLADNWQDAKWVYDTARRLKIPMIAGSSLPGLWRFPSEDVTPQSEIKEVVATTYGSLDAYGFHALEMVQCLVEQRKGGETGIASAQCFEGEDVWKAMRNGLFDRKLLNAAMSRATKSSPPMDDTIIDAVSRPPVLFHVQYRDGLRVNILSLPSVVNEWTVAWREDNRPQIKSTVFWTQEARPFYHFQILLDGCEKMFHTKKATWPVERTLFTSCVLDALLISKRDDSRVVQTPYLDIAYQSKWRWQKPLPPPPSRPIPCQ